MGVTPAKFIDGCILSTIGPRCWLSAIYVIGENVWFVLSNFWNKFSPVETANYFIINTTIIIIIITNSPQMGTTIISPQTSSLQFICWGSREVSLFADVIASRRNNITECRVGFNVKSLLRRSRSWKRIYINYLHLSGVPSFVHWRCFHVGTSLSTGGIHIRLCCASLKMGLSLKCHNRWRAKTWITTVRICTIVTLWIPPFYLW